MPRRVSALLTALLTVSAVAPASAQQGEPLSVIDWLDSEDALTRTAQRPPAQPQEPEEPPVAISATPPAVEVRPLDTDAPRNIGLVPRAVTGLPANLWSGTEADTLVRLIERLPDPRLPAGNALLYTVLLAEADAPKGGKEGEDALTLARVRKLVDLGALDPAASLIELAGATASPAHFALWSDISLLTGHEEAVCTTLAAAPHLSSDYGLQIFCDARNGHWEDAALTLGSVDALGLLPREKLNVLARFLDPEYFEGMPPLPRPREIDPLTFRLYEAIGEPLPTGPLPRPYAVADLRDLAGWKSQLEAAERLTRTGALPDNRLLGIYSDRKPAASGGIWDRVDALRRFETALATGSTEAVSKTLPPVWEAMRQARLEVSFAGLFAEALAALPLEGNAARLAFRIGLLSPRYETIATGHRDTRDDLLVSIATGTAPARRPTDALEAAIHDAFAEPTPRADLVAAARASELGATILRCLILLHDGAEGDAAALRDALSTLRTLGLEDTARRAALQVLLLDRAT